MAAIDPGVSGGVAVMRGTEIVAMPLPQSPNELHALLEDCDEVAIEDVPCFCGKAVPSHTAFKLGKSCGAVEAIANLSGAVVHRWKPQQWQKALGIRKAKGETQQQWKARLRDEATNLTALPATLKTADALLLLHLLLSRDRD